MSGLPLTYDPQRWLVPFWQGDTVLHESVLFLQGESSARLLYPAVEITGVYSADLATRYRPGDDYKLVQGELYRPSGSRMPEFPLKEYFPSPEDAAVFTHFNCTLPGRPYIRYAESDTFTGRQIAVSYRHKDAWTGELPRRQEKFSRFFEKVQANKPVTVLFYGDSITTGANCSSVLQKAPFMPSWPEMTVQALQRRFPAAPIRYVNTAVGGTDSRWGADSENLDARVLAYRPDLLFLAFGMNDAEKTPREFIDLADSMVRRVQAALPQCDICLISTTLPHRLVAGFWRNQEFFEAEMEKYVQTQAHVGLVPMTTVHRTLLQRKAFYHMTANNVNHPNDFLSRAYTMSVLQVLG